MSRNIKAGKIALPMDVRSSNDVPAFEHMLSKGPMAVVLVYADWCGHCTNYKKNVWSPLKSMKNRTVNMASVHYDQLENTSLKNSKIDGYPSLLLVGQDKKPATFGSTNAMPNANDINTMKKVVASPKANTVSSLNVSTNLNLSTTNNSNVSGENSVTRNLLTNSGENSVSNFPINSGMTNNSNMTNNSDSMIESAVPPSIEADEIVETPETAEASPRVRTSNQGATPLLRGGKLYRRLSSKKDKKAHRKVTKKSKGSKRNKHGKRK